MLNFSIDDKSISAASFAHIETASIVLKVLQKWNEKQLENNLDDTRHKKEKLPRSS